MCFSTRTILSGFVKNRFPGFNILISQPTGVQFIRWKVEQLPDWGSSSSSTQILHLLHHWWRLGSPTIEANEKNCPPISTIFNSICVESVSKQRFTFQQLAPGEALNWHVRGKTRPMLITPWRDWPTKTLKIVVGLQNWNFFDLVFQFLRTDIREVEKRPLSFVSWSKRG